MSGTIHINGAGFDWYVERLHADLAQARERIATLEREIARLTDALDVAIATHALEDPEWDHAS